MVARNGKPMQFVFLTLKKDFLVCNFQLFQKLDSTKFIFRTFHFEPWMKMSSCVTDVWREGFLVLRNSPFLAPSSYADGLRSQASQDGNNLVCEHNFSRTQRVSGDIRPAPVKRQMRLRLLISKSHFTHDTITRSQASRSLVFLTRG